MTNFFKSSFIIICGIFATLMLSCSCCNKEHNHKPCPKPKPVDIKFIIGQAEKDCTITLLFDKEAFDCVFRRCVKVNLDGVYEYEDIKIVDDKPYEKKSTGALQLTLFNVERGVTDNIFLVLEKEITGKYVKYYTTNNRNDRRVVTCEGTNCATDGCRWDSEKQICTDCGNPNGTCKVTDAPDVSGRITWKDVIEWVVKIFGSLIGIFKFAL